MFFFRSLLTFTAGTIMLNSFSNNMVALADDISPEIHVHELYSADYLKTLSQEDFDEAIKPKTLSLDEAGKLVIVAKDVGDGTLPYQFVPCDPRSWWLQPGDLFTYGIKEASVAQDGIDTTTLNFWFEESLDIWFRESQCVDVETPFTKVPVNPDSRGFVEDFFETSTFDFSLVEASLTMVGFRDILFFQLNPNVLGVAFTLSWVDPDGFPSDMNGDGYVDKAIAEIYFNPNFQWTAEQELAVGGVIDFPTVAFHEAGHGIGASHFGQVTIDYATGTIDSNPSAIMNAAIFEARRDFKGHDTRVVCELYTELDTQFCTI